MEEKIHTHIVTDTLFMRYILNEDGLSTTATIIMQSVLDLRTNQFFPPVFSVKAFRNPKTSGYFRGDFDTYSDAKNKLDELINTFHCPLKIEQS